jgi:hypothetical protein
MRCKGEMASRRTTGTRARQARSPLANPTPREEGQSLLEMTFGVAFLLAVVIVLFESVMIFRSYIGVLNSAREGAFWVAHHPDMWFCDQVTCETASPDGGEAYELIWHICQEATASGLDPDYLTVLPPETPEGTDPQDPIIITIKYEVVNPTHGIVLPWLDRMGLLESFTITGSSEVPIRYGLD